ncbi:MAG: SOS response-associated peptidase [Bacteroidota bacterium]|nr:SOS response-associated peptidase [Bacteroidota bacterium]
MLFCIHSSTLFRFHITLKDKLEYFFMAGVSHEWKNEEMQQSADTFAIVTTEANELMQFVHNEKNECLLYYPGISLLNGYSPA